MTREKEENSLGSQSHGLQFNLTWTNRAQSKTKRYNQTQHFITQSDRILHSLHFAGIPNLSKLTSTSMREHLLHLLKQTTDWVIN